MKCPACDAQLETITASNVTLNACLHGCGGIWFDRDEMEGFDAGSEPVDPRLLEIKTARPAATAKKVKPCPVCEGEVLIRQFFDAQNKIEIDQCWNCCGIWLDSGELLNIRNESATDAERADKVKAIAVAAVDETRQAMKSAALAEAQSGRKPRRDALQSAMSSFLALFEQLFG